MNVSQESFHSGSVRTPNKNSKGTYNFPLKEKILRNHNNQNSNE